MAARSRRSLRPAIAHGPCAASVPLAADRGLSRGRQVIERGRHALRPYWTQDCGTIQ